MNLKDIQDLYAYNGWANQQVMKSLENLTAELFTRDLKTSHQSIQGTVAHLASAEWIWLQRWKGTSPTGMLPVGEFASVPVAIQRWQEIDHNLAGYLADLGESDLERPLSFSTTQGKKYSHILWQALQHMANHSTYHRGQIASLLRQVGATPQATDLILYYRLHARSA